jgi:hypothetical protein
MSEIFLLRGKSLSPLSLVQSSQIKEVRVVLEDMFFVFYASKDHYKETFGALLEIYHFFRFPTRLNPPCERFFRDPDAQEFLHNNMVTHIFDVTAHLKSSTTLAKQQPTILYYCCIDACTIADRN